LGEWSIISFGESSPLQKGRIYNEKEKKKGRRRQDDPWEWQYKENPREMSLRGGLVFLIHSCWVLRKKKGIF